MVGASTLARPRLQTAAPDPPPAAIARRPRDRRFWLAVGAALLAGLALRLAIGATDDAPSTDEVAYLGSGLSLVEGTGFARGGHPELHFPPLIPALLGGTGQVVPDPHTGAVIVTWLAGAVLIVPLALLGRRLGGDRAGVAVAWVAALAPGLATTPAARGAGSE
jgi:4-amino-4-deoxy-L-arabinose transferase-like glycosyltransferase